LHNRLLLDNVAGVRDRTSRHRTLAVCYRDRSLASYHSLLTFAILAFLGRISGSYPSAVMTSPIRQHLNPESGSCGDTPCAPIRLVGKYRRSDRCDRQMVPQALHSRMGRKLTLTSSHVPSPSSILCIMYLELHSFAAIVATPTSS
jgi:hypothetical protein